MNIRKRYSEFDDFRYRLVQTFPGFEAAVPALPPKSVISKFRPRFLEKRRAGLQYFLKCVPSVLHSNSTVDTNLFPKLYTVEPRVLWLASAQGVPLCIASRHRYFFFFTGHVLPSGWSRGYWRPLCTNGAISVTREYAAESNINDNAMDDIYFVASWLVPWCHVLLSGEHFGPPRRGHIESCSVEAVPTTRTTVIDQWGKNETEFWHAIVRYMCISALVLHHPKATPSYSLRPSQD